MKPDDEGAGYFAIVCSGLLLVVASFAIIGAVTICKWIAGL